MSELAGEPRDGAGGSGMLLRVRGLCKRYPGFSLEDVDLGVPVGSVVGFVGVNGAGKTTTIKAALGLAAPDAGTVELFGARLDRLSGAEEVAAKQRLGVVFDACAFPAEMRVGDVERMMGSFYASWDQVAFDRLVRRFDLPRDRRVKELSRGMGMRLTLACALSHEADLLVLDEATAGLDPLARDDVLDVLREFMAREGRGILMSTHITSDLERIADYVVCIDAGRIAFACEKDVITETAGIARCRSNQAVRIEAADRAETGALRVLAHERNVDVLVEDRAAFARRFPDVTVDRATIDEYMALRLRGESR